MKKTRLLSFFLVLILVTSLVLPVALAEESGTSDSEFDILAPNAILVDYDTGEILYEKNAHDKAYPASITKVMTALLTLEAIDNGQFGLEDVITVPESAMEGLADDGSTQNIEPGEQMTVHNLLYCLLVASANEAANILAIQVSGSVSAFVDLMNERAAELGCAGTHFANPHGLHNDDHYTTAYDIYLFTSEAMKHAVFREIVATKEYYVPATNMHDQRHFYNTNGLLSRLKYSDYMYSYATGIKTGHTTESGQCLVSSAEKDGRTLIAVVLGAESVVLEDGRTQIQSFTESTKLLEHGFNDFTRKTILDTSTLIATLPVTLSKDADSVILHPAETLECYLPNNVDPAEFEQTVTLNADSVEAPVTKGQVLGTITLSYNGKEYGSTDLVALTDVSLSMSLYRQKQLHDFFSLTWVRVVGVVLAVLILVLIVRFTFFRRSRRYGHSSSGTRRSGYRGRRRR